MRTKDPTECLVKRDIRGKALNDKYRCTFCYTDISQVGEALDAIFTSMRVYKVDTNACDGTHPLTLKVYAAMATRSRGVDESLEIMFSTASTQAELKSSRTHDVYKVLRLASITDASKVRLLHQMVASGRYAL